MRGTVAVAKEADGKQEFSPTNTVIHHVRGEPEMQPSSLGGVIGNIRRDGGKPSVESIAAELGSRSAAERTPTLLALQQTHGNRYVQRVVSGIQAKLVVGQPGDIYEQEADRVADEVMRMPEPGVQRQVEPEEKEEEEIQTKPLVDQIAPLVQRQEKEEEEEELQAKELSGQTSEISPNLEARINAIKGGGQPLPESDRAFFEPRFGYNFSRVRVHADAQSAETSQAINARAFTLGNDVAFGAGEYAPETVAGKRLLAHELTHVVQQQGSRVQRRLPVPAWRSSRRGSGAGRIKRVQNKPEMQLGSLGGVLGNIRSNGGRPSVESIATHLSSMHTGERAPVLLGLQRTHGNQYVQRVVAGIQAKLVVGQPGDKYEQEADRVADAVMRMAEPGVQRLLAHELTHVVQQASDPVIRRDDDEEEVSNIDRLEQFLEDDQEDEAIALMGQMRRENPEDAKLRNLAVSAFDNEEMAAAVDLLGGNLEWKLRWMGEEGTSWELVQPKLQACKEDTQKEPIRNRWKDFFIGLCNNEEMAAAVTLLGGTLLQKLTWMLAEGTNVDLVYSVIRISPTEELPDVSTNRGVMDGLRSELSRSEFERVLQMLSGLLYWEETERSASEKHYERETATSPWELETFNWTTAYEIQYTRTELKVIVRINLTGETTTAALRSLWITGIQNRWNSHFHIENSRRLRVVFEPVFTSTDSHHTVEIHTGRAREEMTNWYLTSTGDTAAHEFGHMVGLKDEYRLTREDYTSINVAPPPGPEPSGGYTMPGLMGTAAGPVQGRHIRPFVAWLNRHRLRGERAYRLVAGL